MLFLAMTKKTSGDAMEVTEIIFWSLFGTLFLAEILIVFILRVKDSELRDWVEPAFFAMAVAAVLRIFFIQAFRIPSESMEHTFLKGDQLLVNKWAYGSLLPEKAQKAVKFPMPKRGEIAIFRYPQDINIMFIKRCVGLPGDIIQVKNKQLFINNKIISEPYVWHSDKKTYGDSYRDNFGPIKVPAGSYFMMGDNRDNSADSRHWGFLPGEYFRGRAWLVYWPPKRWTVVKQYFIDADVKSNTANNAAAVEVR